MQKNVGDFDAYIRITVGLFMIGSGIMKSSKGRIAFGAIKVAEGVTRFCPMFHLLNLSTVNFDEKIERVINKTKIQSFKQCVTED